MEPINRSNSKHETQAELTCTSASEQDESTDEEELSRQLYDNGCSHEHAQAPGAAVESAHRLVVALQQMALHLCYLAWRLVPLAATCFGLVLFHCYLFRPFPQTAIASHWIFMMGLTSTHFKAVVCTVALVLLFARLANAFAVQAAAARALMEAEFQSAAWQLVLKPDVTSKLRQTLQPIKMTYMISAKWANAFLQAKKFTLVTLVLAMLLCHAALILITGGQLFDSSAMQSIFCLFLLFLLLCLFSTDLLLIEWECVTAACLVHYMLHLACTWLIKSYESWDRLLTSFLVLRDALDYVPRLDLDRIMWHSGNTGSGTDFASYLITILLDGVIIGSLHDANLVSEAVRLLGVFGGNFLGLTGVEALAVASTVVMPLPCALMLVFPYLRRMSQSELAFVCCVILNCSHASSDRRFLYFGEERNRLLLIVVFFRQFCIVGSIVVCKILYPARIQRYISCAGYQYPHDNTTMSSFGRRLVSGGLEGLKLGMVVCKVVLISHLTSIILFLVLDVLLYFISSVVRNSILTTQEMLKLSFMPWLFPLSDSQETLGYLVHQIVESITFKRSSKQIYLTEVLRFLYVKRRYHPTATAVGGTKLSIASADMLTAKYFYDSFPASHLDSGVLALTPVFGMYMCQHTENLVEHSILMSIFFYHCLKGSGSSRNGLISKVVLASMLNILINIRIMWHAINY